MYLGLLVVFVPRRTHMHVHSTEHTPPIKPNVLL